MKKIIISLILIFTVFYQSDIFARIKLTALPKREKVVAKLTNLKPTLVEEERTLSLQKGINLVDFSWKNVSIDQKSIKLFILSHPDKVRLINISYPPGENSIIMKIFSEEAFSEKVRLTYLLKNINLMIDYTATVNKEETKMQLKIYAVLRNFSGENFKNAIFTTDEGKTIKTSIDNNETKRIFLTKIKDIPIGKEFIFDSKTMPWNPDDENKTVGIPMYYTFKNDKEHNLGSFVFKRGKIRIFQEDGHGSKIFLGEDQIDTQLYPGDEVKIYISQSRDIKVEQNLMKSKRINIRRNHSNYIILYDVDEILKVKIKNFKNKPAKLKLIEYIDGEWEMKQSPKYEKENYQKLIYTFNLKPKEEKTFKIHYIKKNIRR